ncbi:MAG: nitrous oxide-stimulated promoter family protein [Chloroflexi bacterium]|nr:nitrous oxide-stimulated promoter family protein [Chloroflexota bacterium]
MSTNNHPRIIRENKTVQAMIHIYCRGQHGAGDELCSECSELLGYARERLVRCPFQEGKTTCANCAIHCYKHDMRERVRVVMRYAGPRMLSRHPILALLHLLDGLQKEPVRSERATIRTH